MRRAKEQLSPELVSYEIHISTYLYPHLWEPCLLFGGGGGLGHLGHIGVYCWRKVHLEEVFIFNPCVFLHYSQYFSIKEFLICVILGKQLFLVMQI